MKWQEIETAIEQHIDAVTRFKEAGENDGQNMALLIEIEFAARAVVVNARGDETGDEVRRLSYLMGYFMGSRVLERERLTERHCRVHQ